MNNIVVCWHFYIYPVQFHNNQLQWPLSPDSPELYQTSTIIPVSSPYAPPCTPSMSDIRSLTLLRLEASGPFLAPVNVIFQKVHDLAVTPSGVLSTELKNDLIRWVQNPFLTHLKTFLISLTNIVHPDYPPWSRRSCWRRPKRGARCSFPLARVAIFP